jgi:hypothetical protein
MVYTASMGEVLEKNSQERQLSRVVFAGASPGAVSYIQASSRNCLTIYGLAKLSYNNAYSFDREIAVTLNEVATTLLQTIGIELSRETFFLNSTYWGYLVFNVRAGLRLHVHALTRDKAFIAESTGIQSKLPAFPPCNVEESLVFLV